MAYFVPVAITKQCIPGIARTLTVPCNEALIPLLNAVGVLAVGVAEIVGSARPPQLFSTADVRFRYSRGNHYDFFRHNQARLLFGWVTHEVTPCPPINV